MANPITWHNVTQSDWSNDGSANAALVANSLGGIGDTLRTAHEDKSKRLTGEAKAFISSLTDPQAMARQVADYSAGMDKRYVDMGQMADFQQGHKTAVLNQDAQAFDNEHAPERLEAALASSRAYARSTNSNQDIIDEARLYSAKMEKITNGVERNKDGSLNRPAIRKIATEANIPSKHQDIGMDQANATSGFNDILASNAEKLKHQRAKAIKMLGGNGSKGSADSNVYTGYDDSPWLGWGQGQAEVNKLVADLKLKKYTKDEITYVLANSTKERGLMTVGPKEHSSAKAKLAILEVLEIRKGLPGK